MLCLYDIGPSNKNPYNKENVHVIIVSVCVGGRDIKMHYLI